MLDSLGVSGRDIKPTPKTSKGGSDSSEALVGTPIAKKRTAKERESILTTHSVSTNGDHQRTGGSMVSREALAWKTTASRMDIADTPSHLLNQCVNSDVVVESISRRGTSEEPWADGFITPEGTHIPLFVPLAPRD